MKLLMIYCKKFGYRTSMKTLDDIPDLDEEKTYDNVLTAFIQIEAEDEENASYVETKLIKNIKWAARKNETENVILHSFAHLSDSKATPETTKQIFDNAQQRLENSGYQTSQTPFGYFLDLHIEAPGFPLARLFKDI